MVHSAFAVAGLGKQQQTHVVVQPKHHAHAQGDEILTLAHVFGI